MESSSPKQFFPALTGLRAIAAWMIFLYHIWPFNRTDIPQILTKIVSEFHIGVDIFFVLSGFLITYRYYNDVPIHFKKYMVNRFARIYPMYFLVTLGVFVSGFLQNSIWDSTKTIELITSFTLTKALFSDFFFGGIPQGWTLTLEELFYLSAPLYFILIRKYKALLWLLPIAIFGLFSLLQSIFINPNNQHGFLQVGIHSYIIEFFAGIALALFLLKKKNIQLPCIFTVFGIAFICLYFLFHQKILHAFNLEGYFGHFIIVAILSFFGIAPLLWGLINEKTPIQHLLSTKTFVLLGKSSYIFYLIHKGIVFNYLDENVTSNKFIIFIILNIISVLLFYFIEEPMNHFIRRKFGKA